ncbi:hypothetical protein ASPVEDRAFT_84618 [Aspergillus versicolor CBS 583.65]|uniref:Uncharacterized protein n=1 Tax=Aspergillus versicolor CBS 583.65 TaxID=1036611 RepID=A0A1L9PNT2_ASPVE|nr:uncharacterized protein ASPVEDRAFT_84618 [Aspergillus versicolor CBS 583.65]OJJ03163.1 hypothetical protein ASPVEDRAFT_84618 [Aspergillus versicolor CBS 583.65]
MTPRISWLSIAIALGGLSTSGAAQAEDDLCSGWFWYPPTSLGDYQSCPTGKINGTIGIDPDEGPVVLPNLVTLNGTLQLKRTWREITSISAPDLESANALDFANIMVGGLDRISFPSLRNVSERISFRDTTRDATAEFPVLEHAGSVTIEEHLLQLHMDSLESVADDFDLDNAFAGVDGLAVTLPSLTSVGFLKLGGNLTSISLPKLMSAGSPKHAKGAISTEAGLRLHLGGRWNQVPRIPFALNFPMLEYVDTQFYVHGPVDSLNLPSLTNTTAAIHIDSTQPLSLSLPLRTASTIELLGAIKHASLPNLTQFTHITVASTTNFNCDRFIREISETAQIPEGGQHSIICSSVHGNSSGLSLGGKIAIGVVVPVAVLVLALLVICLRRRRRRAAKGKEERAVDQSAAPEYDNTHAHAPREEAVVTRTATAADIGPPPPYSPREDANTASKTR